MSSEGTKLLETKRLILRKFNENDFLPSFLNWTNDSETVKFLTWPAHGCLKVTEEVIGSWIKNYEHDNFYQWAVVLKETNEPIGTISVVRQNVKIKMAHVGYCIGSRWFHKGYTSEAFSKVIEFLFMNEGFVRIEAQHDPKNIYSGKVMEKCGLKYEGTLKDGDFNNQGICDAAVYAILYDDFIKGRN